MRNQLLCSCLLLALACSSEQLDPPANAAGAGDSCRPNAGHVCVGEGVGSIREVDSCGNVSSTRLLGCPCGCSSNGLDCSEYIDPLEQTYGCSRADECVDVGAHCELREGRWSVMYTFASSCPQPVHCWYHHYVYTPTVPDLGLYGLITSSLALALEPAQTEISRGVGLDDRESCEKFLAETVVEAWACALDTDPESCLPPDHDAAGLVCGT